MRWMYLFSKLGGDVFDLIGDVDPTDEDGDIGMGDSTGVSTSLDGEILSGGNKCRESNIGDSDNTEDGGKIVAGIGTIPSGKPLRKPRILSGLLILISLHDLIRTDLSYVEEPEAILDRQDRVIRKKTIPFVKILWRNHPEREATWETEESIRTSYPHFLP
nr:hypothetical protein [Tanacetum cinerariifolium]